MRVTACIHRPAPQPRTFITGTVLHWGQTVEKIQDQMMQVPCLILDEGGAVHVLSLRTATTWTTIEKLP